MTPQLPTLSDADLMRCIAGGDRAALGELFRRRHEAVYALVARWSGDEHLAEDLTQETFLQVWRSRESYEDRQSLKAFLYTIALNKLRDAKRRLANRPATELDSSTEPAADNPVNDELPVPVSRAVSSLPESQRTILLLAKYDGMTYEEIAQITNLTTNQVRGRLCRALATVRGKLGVKQK